MRVRPLACLHHLEPPSLGLAADVLAAAGVPLDERRVAAGEPLPAIDEISGLLVLGGHESACEPERYPYLAGERELLRQAVAAGLPTLGICLGAQLLAQATGGHVARAPRRELGWFATRRLAAARQDPLFGELPDELTVVRWNEDLFEPPAHAVELLERTGAGADAFRVGPAAWGVQFHPELDGAMLDGWYAGYPECLGEAGVSEAEARAADARHAGAQADAAAALFGAFARVLGRQAAPAPLAAAG